MPTSEENKQFVLASYQAFATREGARAIRTGPRDAAMRLARTCYNHFAGRLGVGIADALLARGQIELDQDGGTVTEAGHDFLNRFGVTFAPTTPTGRLFCRPCL